jgi:hypothetical protein
MATRRKTSGETVGANRRAGTADAVSACTDRV